MYGNMGNIQLIIFGILIVAIIFFIITREFQCWYLKINKHISLFQEQNDLLKKLLTHLGVVVENNTDYTIIEKNIVENKQEKYFTVINETALKDSLGRDADTKRLLRVGERVVIMNVVENFNHNWAYIKTQTKNEEGWCLFLDLNES